MDNILYITVHILVLLILFLMFNININDFMFLKKTKLYKFVIDKSYIGANLKLRSLDTSYPRERYLKHSLITFVVVTLTVFITTNSIIYSSIIAMLIIFLLPYYYYINTKRIYNEKINENILIYVSSVILFIQEKKNSLKILIDCKDLVIDPIKTSLANSINYIEETSNYNKALDLLEKEYLCDNIIKIHSLLKNYRSDGNCNDELYKYIYKNIEDYEINLNNYKANKNANRKIFYFIALINIISVLLFKSMFNTTINFDNDIFNFYISH